MRNLTDYLEKKDLKEKIPYYPHTLYISPLVLAAVIAIFYFLFKTITMGKLQHIMDQLKQIERRLLKKETEIEKKAPSAEEHSAPQS